MDKQKRLHNNPTAAHNQGAVSNQAVHQTFHGNLYPTDTPLQDDDLDVLASLAFPGMDDRRKSVEPPYMHTCTWILKLKEYKDWMDNPRGVLWVKGKPGAGKSTLLAFMHREIKSRQSPNNVTLGFFFDARGTELQHTPLGMFRSLLSQLYRQDVETRATVRTIYEGKCAQFGRAKQGWKWRQTELEVILQEEIVASAKRRPLTILVDALDEAGSAAALELVKYFDWVNDSIAIAGASGKICISCRHYPVLSHISRNEICVEKHNRDDISAFIHDSFDLDLDDQSLEILKTELSDAANGIFEWVRLVVPLIRERLSDGESASEIQQFIRRVPNQLGDIYEFILRNVIRPNGITEALALLQWVCLAERPLSVTEMRYAMAAVDPRNILFRIPCHETSGFVSSDNRMRRRVGAFSGGLIKAIKYGDREIVQVIHQSVNEFLLWQGLRILVDIQDHHVMQASESTTRAQNDDYTIQFSQGVLYRACLHYLVTEDLEKIELEDQSRLLDRWPFLDYATINIFLHAEKAQAYRSDDIDQENCLLEEILPKWIASYRRLRPLGSTTPPRETTLLHIACGSNLVSMVRVLLSKQMPPSKVDGAGNTPLHHAARRGNSEIGKMLIGKGADLNVANINGETPLTTAVGHGHREFVIFLLNEGANVDQASGSGGNSLQAASWSGSKAMVQILLDAGADVNAKGGQYGTALQAAADNGRIEVVQLLLDIGADVNAEGGQYGTALQAAANKGRIEVVRLLLDAGADVNAQSGQYGNALQAASAQGGKEVVRLLLDAGAGVDAQGGQYGNALRAASAQGGKEVVRLLLEAGTDVNAQGGQYGTALQAACAQGEKEVVRLLLEAGTDVNAQGGQYGNALQAASAQGEKEVVQILLDAGADANAQGGQYGNALQAASAQGEKEMVQILLDAGADVNELRVLDSEADEMDQETLTSQAASSRGYKDNVPLLLEKGADANSPTGHHDDGSYRGYTITTESRYVSDQVFTAEQKTDCSPPSTSLLGPEDLQTVYSDNFSLKGSAKLGYIHELVGELLTAFSSFRADSVSMRLVAEAMPDYLKAFSLRLSSADSSQKVHREVSAFVRKYKQDIADVFLNEALDDSSAARASGREDNMALDEIMELWSKHDPTSWDDPCTPPVPEHDSTSMDDETWSESIREPHTMIETDNSLHAAMPELPKYRECIFGNPAYDWLLSDLQRHCLLAPSSPDVRAEIRRAIMQSLPSQLHFSRRESPLPYKMSYSMDWDIVSFLADQEYREEHFKALPLVIALTGSQEAAQALTCSQYLHQMWPVSAGEVLRLLQTLLEFGKSNRATGTLQDGTGLVAWFQPAKDSRKGGIVVEVMGSAYSVAEVGEQLAWLGAALRTSPYSDRVAYCQPQVGNFRAIHDKSQGTKRQYAAEVSADISFAIDQKASASNTNGKCWHDLFRNCVVVEGYPISRRPEVGAASGLEIPLPMMASLVQAIYINTFLGSVIIKGFTAMLVPTENHHGLVVWHLLHNKNGDRISYLDSTVDPVKGLIVGRLSKVRHIVGWCSETRYLAGTRAAKYEVSNSRLPWVRGSGILSQAFISSGQMVTGGEPFLIGYKDSPFHVCRKGYLSKLKWIFKKSVVLWDEEAKRGWLLNGATALLHLVRASIVHDSTDPFRSECVFRWENLAEAPAHSTCTPESAIAVLLNRANRALTIYEDKDEHVTFESRVERFLNILEQIFDHQVHAVGPDASGYSSKSIPRAQFEGWDFHDLATDSDPLQPRLARMGSKGRAWIDFTRSIHAITLFGRGFGEILEPSGLSCPYWGSLPKGECYLAAGIADLKMILQYNGDLGANPIRLSDNLVWYNPEAIFDACDCTDATGDHADIVQVILPASLLGNPELRNDPVNLAHNGAVVFGYNRNLQWRWGNVGDPIRSNDVKSNHEDRVAASPGDGHDNSYTVSVGSVSDYDRLSSSQGPSIGDTIVTSSAYSTSNRPSPLVRSYTNSILRSLRAEHYSVGIVCALPLELLAVRALFDQTHPHLSLSAADPNHYALGSIGRHKVVAACLPDGEYGTNSAADVASNLIRSFTSVKLCLLVGIGGGVPSSRHDIRLGDVVVSKPTDTSSGVIQYDMGKALGNGTFEQKGVLHPPPRLVMTALSSLKSDPHLPQAPLQDYIQEIAACRKEYRYPGPEHDRLFSSLYRHKSKHTTCDNCSAAYVTTRARRTDHYPRIHYGLVASGNSLMKDARLRDRWSMERDILCFEMEAAGIVNIVPWLVIRGICDYADSHKNDRFQEYAAATAASYAKLLLSYMKDI